MSGTSYADVIILCRHCSTRINRCMPGCNYGGWFHQDILDMLVPEQANDAHYCDNTKITAAFPMPEVYR